MSKKSSNSDENNNESLPTGWAHRYESAYNQLVDAAPDWMKVIIIDEPMGRHSQIIAHQSVILAERGVITKREREQGELKFDPDYMKNKVVNTAAPSGVAE